jgi:rhodanese-related sulfurtransferase
MRLLPFLILLMIPLIAFPQDNSDYKCMTISSEDFYSDMKLKPEIKVIDVRMKTEFRTERIEKAINMPLASLPCSKADKMNRETVLYLYCKSGVRSCWAAAKFNKMGFKHVYSLEGGLNAWKKAGLPLLTGRKGVIEPRFIPLSPYPPISTPTNH